MLSKSGPVKTGPTGPVAPPLIYTYVTQMPIIISASEQRKLCTVLDRNAGLYILFVSLSPHASILLASDYDYTTTIAGGS